MNKVPLFSTKQGHATNLVNLIDNVNAPFPVFQCGLQQNMTSGLLNGLAGHSAYPPTNTSALQVNAV